MLGAFEEINRLKEDKSRRTINDNISDSDNYSEDAYSIEDRSENRSSSTHKRQKQNMGLSQSREKIKARERELEL
jgi:hypothetical protein